MILKGEKQMQQRIQRIASKFPDKVKGALRIEAEMIMTRSKRDFVPVDLGPLRASGHVDNPVRVGKDISVKLSYGGAASEYALAVHEHPGPHDPPSWRDKGTASSSQREERFGEGDRTVLHPGYVSYDNIVTFHPQGRGPKYLERPMMEASVNMTQRLATRLGADIEDLSLG